MGKIQLKLHKITIYNYLKAFNINGFKDFIVNFIIQPRLYLHVLTFTVF